MKRKLALLAIALVTCLFYSGPHTLMAADLSIKPVKLKVSSAFPPPGPALVSEILLAWEKEVTKRTNGAITFQNFWGGALGVPAEHVVLIQ